MSQQELWNRKFTREGYLYGTKPNAYLASQLDKLEGGSSILFLGEGEGRNACYAAMLGFEATALDASDVGLEKAHDLSCELGVTISTIHTDLEHWHPQRTYDAVMASFLHLAEPLRTRAFREAMDAVHSGGCFVGEFFSAKQIHRATGGPKEVTLLYTTDELRKIFDRADTKITTLEERLEVLDEGPGHQGEAVVVRIVVQKR